MLRASMDSQRPAPPSEFEVVRDPLWNTIRLDPVAARIIDAPDFQRLRLIRQLGLAYLVYPGAQHTRFDHALGVYHLARWVLGLLADRGELANVDPAECRLLPYAALLHDIGHYPFSHALEELGKPLIPEDHEELADRFLGSGAIGEALAGVDADAPGRIASLVRGRSPSPLQGLVSGSLDLDKIEYLRRDARFCGVPYGEVDVDRLLHALTLVPDPATGRLEVGVHEKGLSALESLLFSKYQMFRNVYWHHAVRAATALYKRLVEDAIGGGALEAGDLVGETDERLLARLEIRCERSDHPAARRVADVWIPAIRERRLPKRALQLPGEALRGLPGEAWLADAALRAGLESRLVEELGEAERGVLVDYPAKPRMMGLDILLLRRSGAVQRLTEGGWAGLIDLPRVADELYHTARVLRVFTLGRRRLAPGPLLELLSLPADAARARLLPASRP
jgi:uncharacterized protein